MNDKSMFERGLDNLKELNINSEVSHTYDLILCKLPRFSQRIVGLILHSGAGSVGIKDD